VIRIRSETPLISACGFPEKSFLRGISTSSWATGLSKRWSPRLFGLDPVLEEFQQVVGGAQVFSFRRTGHYASSHQPGGVPNSLNLTEDRFQNGSLSFQDLFRFFRFHFLYAQRLNFLARPLPLAIGVHK